MMLQRDTCTLGCSVDRACRDYRLDFSAKLTTIASTIATRGGLRSTLDCRPRRALLHLSCNCAPRILTRRSCHTTHWRTFGLEVCGISATTHSLRLSCGRAGKSVNIKYKPVRDRSAEKRVSVE